MRPEDIKVEVKYTEGYQKRYTEACLKVIKRREEEERRHQEEEKQINADLCTKGGKDMARENLKKARKEAGLTQKNLAEHLEISERYYKQIEAGQRTGDFTLWDSLEDLLGIHQRILREIQENHRDIAENQ